MTDSIDATIFGSTIRFRFPAMSNADGAAVNKVIGFKVNGDSPQKAQAAQPPRLPINTGSPLPVVIPPPFNKTPRGQILDQQFRDMRLRSDNATESPLEPEPVPASSELTRQIDSGIKTMTDTQLPKSKPPEKLPQGKKADLASSSKKTPQQKKPQKPKKDKVPEKALKSGVCISLFDHLDQFQPFSREAMLRRDDAENLDSVFLQFCMDYAEESLSASAACRGMLEAFSHAVNVFQNPASLFYTREILAFLNHHIGFLISCRALNIAMRNAIRIIKVDISKLKSGIPLEEGKDAVRRVLRGFIEERVDVLEIIAKEADALIKEQDVILTYAASDTVYRILTHAWTQNKRFRVIVVDARPECAGRPFLTRLTEIGIPCTYLFINALGFALKGVSKVMMGASAVLSNGTVMGRAGSASVAMMAHASHIPTVVCCQTLKFHERVQLDSFTHNELGDASALLPDGSEIGTALPFLSLLNLKYDLMPSAFVSIIVSELGFIPATSVPVILREQAADKDISHI